LPIAILTGAMEPARPGLSFHPSLPVKLIVEVKCQSLGQSSLDWFTNEIRIVFLCYSSRVSLSMVGLAPNLSSDVRPSDTTCLCVRFSLVTMMANQGHIVLVGWSALPETLGGDCGLFSHLCWKSWYSSNFFDRHK